MEGNNKLNNFFKIDMKIFNFFNYKISCRSLDAVFPRITHLGGVVFSFAFILILLTFGNKKLKAVAILYVLSILLSQFFTIVIKNTVRRVRPFEKLDIVKTFNYFPKDYSFPSGHTTSAFGLAMTVATYFPSITAILICLASLLGVSRMYIGVHYPTDVFIGVIIGIGNVFIANFVFCDIINKVSTFF